MDEQLKRRRHFADFDVVLNARAVGWRPGVDKMYVDLRDQGVETDVAAQPHTYAGTGGIEGEATLTDKTKPACFGDCFNVSPVLIDPVYLIYQVHFRSIRAVDGVRDRGVPLTWNGIDASNYSTLRTASVASGTYAVSLTDGLIRLGTNPAGQVTADVRGDDTGGYTDNTGQIATRLLTDMLGYDPAAINSVAWVNVTSGPIGLFLPAGDGSTAAAVLDRLAAGALAYWGTEANGILTAGRLTNPDGALERLRLRESDPLDVRPGADTLPVIWKQRVTYRPNFTPQTDFAASVTATDRQVYEQPGRDVVRSDAAIKTTYAGAEQGGQIESLFVNEADAAAVAQRVLDLFGTRRNTFEVDLTTGGYGRDLGTIIRATYGRYGIDNKKFAIIGSREEADKNRSTLILWG